MATPNLTTEVTAYVDFPIVEEKSYNTQAHIFEDDQSIGYQDETAKHVIYTLKYTNQSDAQKASFEAFFDARLGQYSTFYWNHPRTGEVDIKVRFLESKVNFSCDSPVTWSWSVKIRKVL